jgi:hypothetical protein
MSKVISPRTFYCIYAISLVVILCTSFLYSIAPASAQTVDNRCHTEAECKDARKTMGMRGNLDDGFYTGSDAKKDCPSGQGFCAAGGLAQMGLDYSGRQTFANLGEFIQFVYRYGMIIAAILAVLMIIVSGVQWTVSGGNTSTIGAAKKRITGAITGLILLALAYTILNIINPAMVNLRLPQVWIVKEQSLPELFCPEEGSKKFTEYATSLKGKQKQKITALFNGSKKWLDKNKRTNNIAPNKTTCGNLYIKDGNDTACYGTVCAGPDYTCNPATYTCEKVNLAGKVVHLNNFESESATNRIGGFRLAKLCVATSSKPINVETRRNQINLTVETNANIITSQLGTTDYDSTSQEESLKIKGLTIPAEDCKKGGELLGYFLLAEFTTTGTFGALDDWYAIGRQENTTIFNKNLGQIVQLALNGKVNKHADLTKNTPLEDCAKENDDLRCGCLGLQQIATSDYNKEEVDAIKGIKKHLLTKAELKAGVTFHLNVDGNTYGDIDEVNSNSIILCVSDTTYTSKSAIRFRSRNP